MAKYYGKTLTTPEGRFSFPHLFTPVAPDNGQGKPKYSCTILIPKTDKEIGKFLQEAQAEIMEGVKAEWPNPDKRPDIQTLPKALKDGDTVIHQKDPLLKGKLKKLHGSPEIEGCWVVAASGTKKPTVLDRGGRIILDESEIEAGMIGRLMLHFYVCNTPQYCGISCGLEHALLVRDDGTRFGGGGAKAEDGFKQYLGGPEKGSPEVGTSDIGNMFQ